MPTYAYACRDCGHAFDARQSFSDDALTTCPECGGTLRKQFGTVGVVFKGSGFYKTDSRGSEKSGNAKDGGDTGEKSGDGAKQDGDRKASGTGDSSTKTPDKTAKPAASGSTAAQTGKSGKSTSGSAGGGSAA